jgi:regulator of sigma E protease
MLTFVVFILILSLLILVHELGHFIAARKAGVRVEEFGLGLPPRVYGKKIGETLYSLNLLPFGGFVKLSGEDDAVSEKPSKDPRNFMSKTPLQRAVILVAGVLMNFALAVFLYYIFFFMSGFKTLTLPLLFDYDFRYGQVTATDTVITGFSEGSPMEALGVEPGEAVLEIDGAAVASVEELREQLADKAGQEVNVLLADLKTTDDGTRALTVVPDANEDGTGVLGIYLGSAAYISYNTPTERALAGFLHAHNILSYSRHVLGQLIGLSFSAGTIAPVSEGVAGPVGIYSVVGSILHYGGPDAYLGIIDFIALLSLSLAFLNILPFPALDGGRLVFVFIEMVVGKRVKPSVEVAIHKWGIILLLGLIILVTVKDVGRFF